MYKKTIIGNCDNKCNKSDCARLHHTLNQTCIYFRTHRQHLPLFLSLAIFEFQQLQKTIKFKTMSSSNSCLCNRVVNAFSGTRCVDVWPYAECDNKHRVPIKSLITEFYTTFFSEKVTKVLHFVTNLRKRFNKPFVC